jgi:hypothetical protein
MEREIGSADAFTRTSARLHESIVVAASRNRVLIAQFKARWWHPDAALFAAHHHDDRVACAGIASRAGRLHRGATRMRRAI